MQQKQTLLKQLTTTPKDQLNLKSLRSHYQKHKNKLIRPYTPAKNVDNILCRKKMTFQTSNNTLDEKLKKLIN